MIKIANITKLMHEKVSIKHADQLTMTSEQDQFVANHLIDLLQHLSISDAYDNSLSEFLSTILSFCHGFHDL